MKNDSQNGRGEGGVGGGCCRRRGDVMYASPEVRWLAERLIAAGYIVIVVLDSFGGWGVMWLYTFTCTPKPRERRTMLVTVVEAESKREV